jgi:hypothetical protein
MHSKRYGDGWTDESSETTNQPTNQPTNDVSYRGACMRLKTEIKCKIKRTLSFVNLSLIHALSFVFSISSPDNQIFLPASHVSPLHNRPGKFYDQGDANWIVIRRQLRGHIDTPCGRLTPNRPMG